ncbi:MAG: hypothetical protein ACI4JK_00005 [Oscillospiraceae bacterium]
MIKGVNRRIVEISGMKNDYFEKAVLYIRPEKSAEPLGRLELEARSTVAMLSPKEEKPPKSHIIADLTLRLLAVSLGLFSIALTVYLFNL